ncbi:MAG: hypothetical protein H7Y16_10325, partial [Candidatus Parcubacteria bacterium]|nr:hypothetical protein [Burkholderiales bacterium]
ALYVPPIADIFRFAPLGPADVALAAVAGAAGVVWYEGYKLVRRALPLRDNAQTALPAPRDP